MVPCIIAAGEKHTYFISNYYKFTGNDKIEMGSLLIDTNISRDTFDSHHTKYGEKRFEKLNCKRIQTYYLDDESGWRTQTALDAWVEKQMNLDRLYYRKGNIEMVKIFNQKYVLRFENDTVYAHRQCGHQCICQFCYENKGHIGLLKCVVFLTILFLKL